MKLAAFMAISLLAFGLALLVVLWREFRGLTPLTPAEVAFWGDAPVVGTTGWPDDPLGLEELVAGLDDVVPNARGTMLVLGESEREARLAAELAARMRADWLPTVASLDHGQRPEPIITAPPPPSGPYPIGGSQSTALARRSTASDLAEPRSKPHALQLEAWEGPLEGPALRRAARLADRILVLTRAGATPIGRLHQARHRVGRKKGIAYIVVGLPPELQSLPDRVGDVGGFWGLPTGPR
jgi:hypothetical protein